MDSRFSRNNLEDFLLYYSYYFPSRRSSRQKEAVLRFICEKYKDLSYEVNLVSAGKGLNKTSCCVVGDLKKAEHVYMAPLDTCRITHLPGYCIYPLDEKRRTKTDGYADVLETFLAFIGMVIIYFIVSRFTKDRFVTAGMEAAFMLLYSVAQNNRFTFSRSSAMAFVSALAAEKKDPKAAYVFIDNCADSYAGLNAFLLENKDLCCRAKRLIYFDFMANGETLIYASRRKKSISNVDMKTIILNEDYPACFTPCPNLAMIFTADTQENEYIVHKVRSKDDTHVDVDRLKTLLKSFE